MVLVEGIGDFAFGVGDFEGAETFLLDVRQRHIARRRKKFAQCHMTHRPHPRIDQNDMIELLGQILGGSQMVDGLSDVPERGRDDHLALHQATGGILRIGQRLFDRDPVDVGQRTKDRTGLRLIVQIFDQVNDVVGVQLANRVGDILGRQCGEDLLAQRLVQFRQDFPVDITGPQFDQGGAFQLGDLFQNVGDICAVQRFQKVVQRHGIALVQRGAHQFQARLIQLDIIVDFIIDLQVRLGHALSPRAVAVGIARLPSKG